MFFVVLPARKQIEIYLFIIFSLLVICKALHHLCLGQPQKARDYRHSPDQVEHDLSMIFNIIYPLRAKSSNLLYTNCCPHYLLVLKGKSDNRI